MYESVCDPLAEEVKEELLQLAETTPPSYQEADIGLTYLDADKMLEIFAPYMKKHFGKEMKFERAWVHWMKEGGSRPRHQHSTWTYLYYLHIPEGDSGHIVFDRNEIIYPIEGTHIMFPGKTYHSITPNNTKQTRWAFAAEAVPI